MAPWLDAAMARSVRPILLVAASGLMLAGPAAHADNVVSDDLIVQGNACIGNDCVNGEALSGTEIRLKENNLRLRLIDTTASGTYGASWSLMGNDSANGGASYFGFSLQKADTTDEARHVLRVATNSANGTAIGTDSELVDGAVSVGAAGAARRLVRIAEGLADTQVLIKRQLDAGGLGGFDGRADQIEAQLDALEAQIDDLEKAVGSGGGGGSASGPILLLFLLAGLFVRGMIGRMRRSG